jgi:hypothetical protein
MTNDKPDTTADRAQLAKLMIQYEAAGGRGVELAEEIDQLRRKIALAGKKFYRTVITVEVLTDEPYDPGSLEQVHYDTFEGHASGVWDVTEVEETDSERMAQLLIAQGSIPEFLLGEPEDYYEWEEEEDNQEVADER